MARADDAPVPPAFNETQPSVSVSMIRRSAANVRQQHRDRTGFALMHDFDNLDWDGPTRQALSTRTAVAHNGQSTGRSVRNTVADAVATSLAN
jgi:hypothetical protein